MLIKTLFSNHFSDFEVPDGSREERDLGAQFLRIFSKTKRGIDFVLVEEKIVGQDVNWMIRRWFDEKNRTHRPEEDGPAVEEIRPECEPMMRFFKHGKRHCLSGPAFYTADGSHIYCLEGKEVDKSIFDWCVQKNNGKPPKKPKLNLALLKDYAADLSKTARQTGKVGAFDIPQNELHELDLASQSKNWSSQGTRMEADGTWEVSLNCKPLDDTLRCYVFVDQNSAIVRGFLSVE